MRNWFQGCANEKDGKTTFCGIQTYNQTSHLENSSTFSCDEIPLSHVWEITVPQMMSNGTSFCTTQC